MDVALKNNVCIVPACAGVAHILAGIIFWLDPLFSEVETV
jgi:hypothetical protein